MGSRLWIPSDTTTHTWHDPSDAGSLTVVADKVTLFADKSGNGHDLSPTAEDGGPRTGFNTQNGLNVLDFDDTYGWASLQWASGDFADLTSGALGFFLLKLEADPPVGSKNGLHRFGTSSSSDHYPYTTSIIYNAFGSSARKTTVNPSASMTAWHMTTFTSKASFWSLEQNTTQLYSTTSNTVAWRAVVPYGRGDTTHHFQGQMAEHIILDVAYEADKDKIEGYLAHKWGMEGLLPTDHPYKASAPTVFVNENAPSFSTQPVNATMGWVGRVGAHFEAVAESLLGGVTYQWFKDGQAIPGATTANVDIPLAWDDESVVIYVEAYVSGQPTATSDSVGVDQLGDPDFGLENAGLAEWGDWPWTVLNGGNYYWSPSVWYIVGEQTPLRGGSSDSWSEFTQKIPLPATAVDIKVTGFSTRSFTDTDTGYLDYGFLDGAGSLIGSEVRYNAGPIANKSYVEYGEAVIPVASIPALATHIQVNVTHDRNSGTSNNCSTANQKIIFDYQNHVGVDGFLGTGDPLAVYVETVLKFGNGPDGGTTIVNHAPYGSSGWAVAGSAALSDVQSLFGNSTSLRLNGPGDYVVSTNIPYHPYKADTQTKAIVVDMWVWPDDLLTNQGLMFVGSRTSNNDRTQAYIRTDGSVEIYGSHGSTDFLYDGTCITPAGMVVAGQWNFIRLVFSSMVHIYVNGVWGNGRTVDSWAAMPIGDGWQFGDCRISNTMIGFTGYFGPTRITMCQRDYESHVVPAQNYPIFAYDPFYDTLVESHVDAQGLHGVTTITDQKIVTWAATNASYTTALTKYGTSSIDFSAGYLDTTNLPDFIWGNNDFRRYLSIEGWIYIPDLTAVRPIFFMGNPGTDNGRMQARVNIDGSIQFYAKSADGTVLTATSSTATGIATAGWHHFIMRQQGRTFVILWDGTVRLNQQNAGSSTFAYSAPTSFRWGYSQASAVGETLTGNLSDMRITYSGTQYAHPAARWETRTGSAMAPLGLLPASSSTIFLYPVIDIHPQPEFVVDNSTAEFTVSALGEAPLTYQWYEVTAGLLTGETGVTLSFTAFSADSGNEYYVIVTDANTVPTQSNNALLTIVLPPTISLQPVDTSGIEFRDVSFNTLATGNGPFTYDWYTVTGGLQAANAGALYTFPAVFANNGAEYYAIVIDNYDITAQTNNATLTVVESDHPETDPLLDVDISGPADASAPYGQPVSMSVSLAQSVSTPPYIIDWYNSIDGLIFPDGGEQLSFTPQLQYDGSTWWVTVQDSLGLYGQSGTAIMAILPAQLEVSWSIEDGTRETTVIAYQSIAWSLYDAKTEVGFEDFTCPVRTHRGISTEDGHTYWIPFYDKSARCQRGPLVNDDHNRYYWSQDGQGLRYDTLQNLEYNSFTTGYDVGVPPPEKVVAVAAPARTPGETDELWVVRAYVYTYVTVYGEEGPPSLPTTAEGVDGGVWGLSNMLTGPVDEKDRKLASKKIYRTVPSTTGTAAYHFVASVSIKTTVFFDRAPDQEISLNYILESLNWFPPPDDLKGLTSHPNGFFIGYVGRDIYFSEPYRPHAWNPSYVISTIGDIVGFGIFGTTVVVCTTSFPHTMNGIHPGGIVMTQHDTPEPCLSRYGIVSMPFGVYYPGPNGLMLASAAGLQNATKQLMTKEEWQNRYQVKTFDAARYQSQYVAFYTKTKGIMFAPDEPLAALVDLDLTGGDAEPDQMDTIFTDEYSGKTFLLSSCDMYEWNPVSGATLEFDWTSMEFDASDPVNFGASRIIWYSDYTPPTEEQTWAWRVYNTARIAAAPLMPMNFNVTNGVNVIPGLVYDLTPIDAYPEVNQVKVQEHLDAFEQIKQAFHWGPLVWTPVIGEKWPNTPYVIMELIANETVVFAQEIGHTNMFRLPAGFKATRFKIRLRSNINIQSVKIAETGRELAGF